MGNPTYIYTNIVYLCVGWDVQTINVYYSILIYNRPKPFILKVNLLYFILAERVGN